MMATSQITDKEWLGIDNLHFQKLGMFKKIGLMGESKRIRKSLIKGKAIVDDLCIYSIPPSDLNYE